MGFNDNSNSMDDASFDMSGNDGGVNPDFDMNGNDGDDTNFDMNGNDGDDTNFDMNGNDENDNGKPFEDSNFDMGIDENPEDDPKKFIQGAAAKIASELRKYQESMPSPDMELNKTAVNTVAAATKTNLEPKQETELMQSYTDTMKRNSGDGNDGDDYDNFDNSDDNMQDDNFDMNNDNQDMSGMDMSQNQDMEGMNMDNQDMDMNQDQSIQECGDIRLKQKKSKSEVAYPKQKNNYTRKPYTNPLKTV